MEKQEKLSSTVFNILQKLDISRQNPCLKRIMVNLITYWQSFGNRSKVPLKPGDSSAYRKFLTKYDSIMAQQQWNFLDAPEVLYSLSFKIQCKSATLTRARIRQNHSMSLIRFASKFCKILVIKC